MPTIKYQRLPFKLAVTIIVVLGSLLLLILFSVKLQNKTAMLHQSKAFEMPTTNININLPTIPPVNVSIPTVVIPPIQTPIIPTIPPINVGQIAIPTIPTNVAVNFSLSTSTNQVPLIGAVVSQGASIIQQILASPEAKNFIASFLSSVLSGSKSASKSTSQSPLSKPSGQPTPIPTVAPQIRLKTCKEGDGTKQNTCPGRYMEGNKMVYRQCGSNGWCSYTCLAGSRVVSCWDGQKITEYAGTMCRDKDKQTSSNLNQTCPVLYPEDNKEVFRGCDNRDVKFIWQYQDQWCNYTCFKPGTNDVVDCWPNQNTWIVPTAAANIPVIGQPTQSQSTGQCLAKPPAAAKLAGCSTDRYTIAHGVTSDCTTCAGVSAKATCDCPSGTCECDIPASQPPTTVNCTNGGSLKIDKCQ